ncbi:hypothetical protein OAO01_08610, partial [Oligoflexia bacterium]|nr:hypothetical protein [Oligoflexia bacterium]
QIDLALSRLSEPKNYSNALEPKRLTGICAEIPCDVNDKLWRATDEELTQLVHNDLKKVGLPIQAPVRSTFAHRLPFIYPTYNLEYEQHFNVVDQFLSAQSNLVALGRQGLFVHDNTHHTIDMAYKASACLKSGLNWDRDQWHKWRAEFAKHVVVD